MTCSRLSATTALVATTLLLAGCRQKDSSPRRLNVVLVTLDTLRPDRLGCYGGKVKTPHLDELARRGVVWENAVTQAPLTAPAHASMFTGLTPPAHKVRDTGGFILDSSQTTLAEILQGRGWDTAAFVGSAVLKKGFGLGQGFAVYDDEMPKGASTEFPERRADQVVDRALAWLGKQTGKPFFVWVHLFDPHSPYDPPAPFREEYKSSPYDGEVAYTDQQVGRLLEGVRKNAPENTVVAVLSDHGESLGEHGEFTHGVFLYDSTVRIAFLMSGGGLPAGKRMSRQTRAIDLLPTLLGLLAIKPPEGIHGADVAKDGSGPQESYSETLFSKLNMGWVELRALRTDRWKYVSAPKAELYDLAKDPGESANVIGSHSEEAKQLEARLRALSGDSSENVQTTMVSRQTMEQLKSLGYLGGASQQQVALTGQGIDPKDRTAVLKLLHFAVSPDVQTTAAGRLASLRQALAVDPGNPTIYYHLGNEYNSAGRGPEALALYREALRRGIRTGWLYSRMAALYLRQGHRDEAIVAYEQAAQLNPSDSDSLSDLGTAYLETGRLADAERVFRWSLAAAEDHAATHNGLGLLAIRKQDMTTARTEFEKAVQYDPNLLEAQLNLGKIYKLMGANTRARQCFEVFLKKASAAEYGNLIPQIREELKSLP